MNFMTGHSPSWKRYRYYTLRWAKASGERLEARWRYEQWYYSSDSWSGNMTGKALTGLVDVKRFH
jgi:hypothetical protein